MRAVDQFLEEEAQVEQESAGGKSSRVQRCRRCGREKYIKARGLCTACWIAERRKEPSLRLYLDFSNYPELYEKLEKQARKDFRPVELEILYLLKTVLEETNEK